MGHAGQPNIILVMADDVSPEMFGCYGSQDAKTPNLDRMASQGVMFKSAWGSALCCPARAQIMTGCYATQTGFWSNGFSIPQSDGSNNLFRHYSSFGKLMQDAGYTTAVAGKWHIGGAEPPHAKHVGFDEYCLWEGPKELSRLPDSPTHRGAWEDESTPSRYWHPCVVQNGRLVPTKKDDYGPDVFTDFLCDFMERSVKSGKPFLAYYPMVAPHGTRKGSPSTPKYGERGYLGGNKENNRSHFRALNDYIDVLVGRLEEKAKALGVMDNTVIIFCSDNGTASIAKSRGTERGCRIPLIVYGSGIKKRGASDEIADLSDILPSLVDFAGKKLPESMPIDGKSLKPFLTGESTKHREYIFACIGSTRLVRSRTHLLEVVNPILGIAEGRFYYCANKHDGRGYKRIDSDPEHRQVRRQFSQILDKYPGLTKQHPYFQTKKGKRFLELYTKPKAVQKHLHNHKDYQFYDEI
ncbi:sulfatase-like hydrolase/transferase [Verrucomicrobiaceae bacterium N1E253]|uniref:Sulfatase-like hydrolase/transferase n=1 Tax=Oceaniferula marina TaxID=2748318 RepID=A0A851GGP0_9BACT|nr:sulfatase-like hydrolase/transferase [Oceaniferula marina]